MKHLILVVLFLFPLQVDAVQVVRVRRQITSKVKFTQRPVVVSGNADSKKVLRSASTDLHVQGFVSEAWSKVPDYQEYKTIGKYKHRQMIAHIYKHESSYGTYDVCRSKGKANGFGFAEWTGHSPTCYDSFDTVVKLVNDWIEDKVQKGWSYARMNCYYVRGLDTEDCSTSYKLTSIKL